ncbi:MAG: hypothetical protein ACFFAO_05125 [Candidatus Hermodarchaeota archaeon]
MAYDWIFYLSLVCSIGGIIFFIYSLIIVQKIKELFPGAKIMKKWIAIQSLIILFLIGYAFNIVFLFLELSELIIIMVAIVYIFGSIFVALIINLGYKTYKLILIESKSK